MRSILLDIIPRRFRRRSYLVSGTIFLRALLNFAGLALLIPVLLLILDSESMHTNPWLERLYQAGRFESDRAFALTVCGCIVALIAFKNLLNLFLPEGKKLNPMIGAAGISAFPMSGRVVNKMGLAEDNQNFLLMYSISVNVSGQIASVLAGGLILSLMA
jgi:hypothetical protein